MSHRLHACKLNYQIKFRKKCSLSALNQAAFFQTSHQDEGNPDPCQYWVVKPLSFTWPLLRYRCSETNAQSVTLPLSLLPPLTTKDGKAVTGLGMQNQQEARGPSAVSGCSAGDLVFSDVAPRLPSP